MAVAETHSVDHLKYRSTFTRQYLLDTNELLHHFEACIIMRIKRIINGEESHASIIVQKPGLSWSFRVWGCVPSCVKGWASAGLAASLG